MKKFALLFALAVAGAAALVLPGCVVTGSIHEHSHPVIVERPAPVVVAPPPPPPTVIYQQPAPVIVQQPAPVVVAPPPTQVIVVRQAPPPAIVEVIPTPRPGMIWIKGYYAPRGGRWEWVRGHYERPPRPGAVWVEPHHRVRGSDHVEFSMGFWR
jgi:hypothetical protein